MGDYSPVWSGGAEPMSKTASAAITGGQLVGPSGNGTVAPTGVGGTPIGLAAFDAANGGRLTVWQLTGVEHETVNANAGAAAAGDLVIPAAAGGTDRVAAASLGTVAAAGTLIGVVTTGAASGGKMRWIGRG